MGPFEPEPLEKKYQEPEPIGKKKSGAGAAKKLDGSPALKYNFLMLMSEEPAPAPDFFSKRLRLLLLVFVSSGSGSKNQKHPAHPSSGSPALKENI